MIVASNPVGRFGTLVVLSGLLAVCGCSRPEVVSANPETSQSRQSESPFQAREDNAPAQFRPIVESTEKLVPAARKRNRNVSPHDWLNVPPGTLVTVRLKAAVYAGIAPSDALFEAVVVEPVVVGGNTLIPIGTSAAGRVESARTSNLKPNRGYVRLALQTLQLGNNRIPVQTDSLFAREAPMGDSPISAIHLEKGRRLTFRLNEAGDNNDPGPFASR